MLVFRAIVDHDWELDRLVQTNKQALKLFVVQVEEICRRDQDHVCASLIRDLAVLLNDIAAVAEAACDDQRILCLFAGQLDHAAALFFLHGAHFTSVAKDEQRLHSGIGAAADQFTVGSLIQRSIFVPCGQQSGGDRL